MRVLFVEHKTVWGGGQVALVNLLREWQRTQTPVEPLVVCPPDAALVPRVRALGVETAPLALGAIDKTRSWAWNFARRIPPTRELLLVIRRSGSELVYANGAFSFLASVLAAKLARVPLVWVEHNTTLPNGRVLRRMIGAADRVLAVSEVIRAQFLAQVPAARDKVVVVPNGVDTARFCRDREVGLRLRREWGWDETRCVVGTVSRLSPEKGIRYFVEASTILSRALPTVGFVIIGDGPERGELERMAADACIRFLGEREEIPDLLNALDVFVLPSLAEAFGIAAIEAMACALPVVASDVGGLREIVVQNETGLRVPAGDSQALASAVAELVNDAARRREYGTRGRERVRERYTLEQTARQTYLNLEAARRASYR